MRLLTVSTVQRHTTIRSALLTVEALAPNALTPTIELTRRCRVSAEIRPGSTRTVEAPMNHSSAPIPSQKPRQAVSPSRSVLYAPAHHLLRLRHRVYDRTHDDRGALTTEMMILTAVLCLIAVAAYALLNGAMGDAAEQIDVNVDSGG